MAAAQAPARTYNLGIAPDNVRGLATQALLEGRVRALARCAGFNPARCGSATESATEKRPPAERSPMAVTQGNLRDRRRKARNVRQG